MGKDFQEVMVRRTKEQLLAVLRESYDYVPDAVAAAKEELKRRGISGFDIEAANEEAEENEYYTLKFAAEPMASEEILFWVVLPFLAFTPLGPMQFRKYANKGYRRKSIQFLETVFIGFSAYLLLFLLLVPLVLLWLEKQ